MKKKSKVFLRGFVTNASNHTNAAFDKFFKFSKVSNRAGLTREIRIKVQCGCAVAEECSFFHLWQRWTRHVFEVHSGSCDSTTEGGCVGEQARTVKSNVWVLCGRAVRGSGSSCR